MRVSSDAVFADLTEDELLSTDQSESQRSSTEAAMILAYLKNGIQVSDFVAIVPRVKHLSRISFEEGTALTRFALSRPPAEAIELLRSADNKFKETITIKPNDYRYDSSETQDIHGVTPALNLIEIDNSSFVLSPISHQGPLQLGLHAGEACRDPGVAPRPGPQRRSEVRFSSSFCFSLWLGLRLTPGRLTDARRSTRGVLSSSPATGAPCGSGERHSP